jgi:hypothetical protein
VPTATGGIISGNISTGKGSPFGAGGKYEAQVSDIKATIAKAPKGFYDPVGWDDFLKKEELYSEQLPEGVRFYGADDPEIMNALLNIPSARDAMIGLSQVPYPFGTYGYSCPRCTQEQRNELQAKADNYRGIIALYVNQLLLEKNAPAIQAIEQRERQMEIDQAVKIALEQKVRETTTPKPTSPPSFVITDPISPVSYLPFAVVGIVLVVILLFLRRKA